MLILKAKDVEVAANNKAVVVTHLAVEKAGEVVAESRAVQPALVEPALAKVARIRHVRNVVARTTQLRVVHSLMVSAATAINWPQASRLPTKSQ